MVAEEVAVAVATEKKARSTVTEVAAQPAFKPKKGTVLPAKRRLVKRMVFDFIVQSIFSCFTVETAEHKSIRQLKNS
ncbi:Hypothetical predicted protein [Olea europaea subsp. europaea]|uniref:Uncharacterized protein n=1 Tax=Olea europaea subsp. europaea TaxID=158383 RepID=A0A8S0T118_OLEEU|nr:Hypothetical predicted protein [Olea europaea subsp. europaea]